MSSPDRPPSLQASRFTILVDESEGALVIQPKPEFNGTLDTLRIEDADGGTVGLNLTLTEGEVSTEVDNGTVEFREHTIADTNTTPVSDSEEEPLGYMVIQDVTKGSVATVVLDGAGASVTIDADPDGAFTTTQGNAGTTNIFHDGTEYVIENETTVEATYSLQLFKA